MTKTLTASGASGASVASGASAATTASVAGVRVPTGLFIDGEWRRAAGGRAFPVVDPATGLPLAEMADAGGADSMDALAAAHRAQAAWGATAPRERAELLRAAFELIRDRADDFAAVISAEMGRPIPESLAEVDYGSEFFRWFSEQAAHLRGDFASAPSGAFRIVTSTVPVGPSLLITPWNFPLAMGTRKIGAALAAGCTMVVKPAAQTPLTMALLMDTLQQAGIPAGVVNFVPTTAAGEQSKALMSDERLRKVSFTGSTGVGSTLLHQAADSVLRASMELGGNGPFIVLEDADLTAAVDGAMLAKFRNGGQSCVAANRFIVHRAVADRFVAALTDRVAALVVAAADVPGAQLGPLIDERQRARVQALVDDAVAAGATVLTGGSSLPGDGYFFEPTVLTGAPPTARVHREEIFGPVAAVTVVDSDDEAIGLANDTPYGLAAFIYTQNLARAVEVAGRIEAGMVGINRGLVSDPAAPFGGMKSSGLGREGGAAGIEEYLETKYYSLGTD